MAINDFTDHASKRIALIQPVTMIVGHHCSLATKGLDNPFPLPDVLLNGANLSAMFELMKREPPLGLGTGGCRPYHAIIRQDGEIDQCISLLLRGAHALAYNASTLALATVGENGLTPPQRRSFVRVLTDWLFLTDGVPVFGHGSLPDGTRPGHPVCPHPSTDLHALTLEAISATTEPGCSMPLQKRIEILMRRGWTF